jgi:selenate/chlorate reductase subunit gamma
MKLRNPMRRLAMIGIAAAAAWCAASATAAPAVAMAAPAVVAPPKTILVLSAAGAQAASPQAAIWRKAPATEVTLQTAFPGHVSIVGTAGTQKLTAQAVRTPARLFVKLAWRDRTANTAIKDTDQFLDGAAVQFPVNGQAATVPFMGDAANAVNVWHWRADGRTQNILAKGFGTSTPVPTQGLRSASVRTSDGWEVVLSRPLRVKAEEGADLQGRRTIPIGFAAWDGDNQERDGFKAVTMEWWQLAFEGGAAQAAAGSAAGVANDPALQLAQKNNCGACHAVDAKVVGPSWKDIGKKYAGDAAAEARLVAKVKAGGGGVWGPVPMPPNPTVKEGDIKAIVRYSLSLK